MPIPSNVSSRVSLSQPAITGTTTKDGIRCHDTSRTGWRRTAVSTGRSQVGQKIVTDLFLKTKQDTAKYNLFMFMIKLLNYKH